MACPVHPDQPTSTIQLPLGYTTREKPQRGGGRERGDGADIRPDVGSNVHTAHTLVSNGSAHSSRPYVVYIYAITTECTVALDSETELKRCWLQLSTYITHAANTRCTPASTLFVSEISNELQNVLLITRRSHSRRVHFGWLTWL